MKITDIQNKQLVKPNNFGFGSDFKAGIQLGACHSPLMITSPWNSAAYTEILGISSNVPVINSLQTKKALVQAFHLIISILKRKGKETLIYDPINNSEIKKDANYLKNFRKAILVFRDPKKEKICIQEAHTLGITLIGIADTNCDPEELDYVIPGNDDAIRAVKLIVARMADAVIEANQGEAIEVAEETEATDAE